MKLLANENFPLTSVRFLVSAGFDIKVIGKELASIKDSEVMQIAAAEERLILTFDRDYGELIFKHKLYPPNGVLYLRLTSYAPDEPGKIVQKLIANPDFSPERKLIVFDGETLRQRSY